MLEKDVKKTRRRREFVVVLALTAAGMTGAPARAAPPLVVQVLSAPGNQKNYYIMRTPGAGKTEIEEALNGNTTSHVLLREHPSNDPYRNLTDFSNLFLSPDSKALYFESAAWATADAVYAIDIATKKIRFITSGGIACVVLAGEYQGDLIVSQHRYFVEGGSYNDLYLFTPHGKDIGIVAEGIDASRVCPTLP